MQKARTIPAAPTSIFMFLIESPSMLTGVRYFVCGFAGLGDLARNGFLPRVNFAPRRKVPQSRHAFWSDTRFDVADFSHANDMVGSSIRQRLDRARRLPAPRCH